MSDKPSEAPPLGHEFWPGGEAWCPWSNGRCSAPEKCHWHSGDTIRCGQPLAAHQAAKPLDPGPNYTPDAPKKLDMNKLAEMLLADPEYCEEIRLTTAEAPPEVQPTKPEAKVESALIDAASKVQDAARGEAVADKVAELEARIKVLLRPETLGAVIKLREKLAAAEARAEQAEQEVKRWEEADALFERTVEAGRRRAMEILKADNCENVDHAAERVMQRIKKAEQIIGDALYTSPGTPVPMPQDALAVWQEMAAEWLGIEWPALGRRAELARAEQAGGEVEP